MPGWELAAALSAQTFCLQLFGPARCECVCGAAASGDDRAFQLLERQLDRCGPANLTAAAPVTCPPFPEPPSTLLAVGLGFLLGVLVGGLAAALYLLGSVSVGHQVRSASAPGVGRAPPASVPAITAAAPPSPSSPAALTPAAKRAAILRYGDEGAGR